MRLGLWRLKTVVLADYGCTKRTTRVSDGKPLEPSTFQSWDRILNEWRRVSPHPSDCDWIFPSLKMRGTIPMSAGIFVADYLRKAAKDAGVMIPEGQRFGLHSFRSSLATWMVSVAKTDLKTAQGSLRHANPKILLDRYARSVTDQMVAAQGQFLEEMWNAVEQPRQPMSLSN